MRPRAEPFVPHNVNDADVDIETQIADNNGTKMDIVSARKQYADEHEQNIADDWRFVALVLDRFLFWIFLIANALISVIILCIPRD
jgi:hypothetical protein